VSVFNRRNAVVGWATLAVGKRIARRKLRGAVPSVEVPEKARRFGRRAKEAVPTVEVPEKARRFGRRAKETLPLPEPERKRRRTPRALAFLAALGVGVATYLRSRGRPKPPGDAQ
jgi:hypothetical protein